MSETLLKVETQMKIAKDPALVFEAIVNPAQMAGYFISSGSARLDAGGEVTWEWHDVGGQLNVMPQTIEKDRLISFLWLASGSEALVTFTLEDLGDNTTLVKLRESGWPPDEEGIARCLQQMQGWVHMLCCMKAYLEHGINLRSGGVVK